MKTLRVGTRGSDLALAQTRWVVERLRTAHSGLAVKEVVIKTDGDRTKKQISDPDWPVGGFVGAIEQALTDGKLDFAVHSYKDLATAPSPGLIVAAVPEREVVHDVLVSHDSLDIAALPRGLRIGTGSPRRIAQLKHWAEITIVPMRGNVPTRIGKVDGKRVDAVVLAAAGLRRLGIRPRYCMDLPTDRFVPAPAQGALAIQVRAGDKIGEMMRVMEDAPTRRRVEAERSFLAAVGGGCQIPVAALATIADSCIMLHGQIFREQGDRVVEGVHIGNDPCEVGRVLAVRLLAEMRGGS